MRFLFAIIAILVLAITGNAYAIGFHGPGAHVSGPRPYQILHPGNTVLAMAPLGNTSLASGFPAGYEPPHMFNRAQQTAYQGARVPNLPQRVISASR